MSVVINQSGVAVTHHKVFKKDMYGVHVRVVGVREVVFSAVSSRVDEAAQEVWDKVLQASMKQLLKQEQTVLLGHLMRGELV